MKRSARVLENFEIMRPSACSHLSARISRSFVSEEETSRLDYWKPIDLTKSRISTQYGEIAVLERNIQLSTLKRNFIKI